MKFVGYYRVSTNRQDYGLQAQRDAVANYVKSVSGELVASFEEKESGANNERPELARAIKTAKAENAILIVGKLDRLSRSASLVISLQESNLDFVCVDMPHADRFTIGIIALVAQRERELISQRTKEGLRVAKSLGKRLGNRTNAPTAWNKALDVIQTRKRAFAEQAVVHIREIQSTGIKSLNRISDCLNKRGERTARGGTWTATAVKRALAAAGDTTAYLEKKTLASDAVT